MYTDLNQVLLIHRYNNAIVDTLKSSAPEVHNMSTQITIQETKVPLTFVGTHGAQMIAAIVNSILFGVGSFVGMQYLFSFGRTDPIVVKGTVLLLMLFATLETISTNHQTYANFIQSFGDMADLDNIVFSVPTKYLFVYLTTFVAQLFFLGCIWVVSPSLGPRYRYLAIPVLLLSVIQFIAGTLQVVLIFKAKTFIKLGARTPTSVLILAIQGGGTAACDVLITFILVYIFRETNTSEHRTKSLLDNLVNYALNRAVATSFCAILTVFLFYYLSGTYYFLIPALASTHLNVISIVSLISSRSSLRDKIDSSVNSSKSRSTPQTYPSFIAAGPNAETEDPGEQQDPQNEPDGSTSLSV
ncbi:hypothetical protein BDQ17DRAFT_130605 [Cyathus striatus]|nr:hypothetical protein BDQ17DRAFT_130605 [Cyathus striatus]